GSRAMPPVPLPGGAPTAAAPRGAGPRLDIRGEVILQGAEIAYEAAYIEPRTACQGVVIDTDIGGLTVTLALEGDALRAIRLDRLAGLSLNPASMALAVEHLLTSDIDFFEAAKDTTLSLREVSLGRFDTSQAVLALRLTWPDGTGLTGYVWSPDNAALARALAERFEAKRRPEGSGPRVRAAIIGPIAEIPRKRLRKVTKGAVFCPAPGWANLADELFLLVKGEHLIRLTPHGHGYATMGDETDMHSLGGGTTGDDMTDTSRKGSLANPRALVTVELHRRDMTLAELSDLQKDDILDLDLSGIETVTLAADGKPFAKGKLVQLDDVLGVMVSKLL
ncbi:MAG: FliM/FliN family flagellar motor switch protein, partial [Pseudomonadota bacterium]